MKIQDSKDSKSKNVRTQEASNNSEKQEEENKENLDTADTSKLTGEQISGHLSTGSETINPMNPMTLGKVKVRSLYPFSKLKVCTDISKSTRRDNPNACKSQGNSPSEGIMESVNSDGGIWNSRRKDSFGQLENRERVIHTYVTGGESVESVERCKEEEIKKEYWKQREEGKQKQLERVFATFSTLQASLDNTSSGGINSGSNSLNSVNSIYSSGGVGVGVGVYALGSTKRGDGSQTASHMGSHTGSHTGSQTHTHAHTYTHTYTQTRHKPIITKGESGSAHQLRTSNGEFSPPIFASRHSDHTYKRENILENFSSLRPAPISLQQHSHTNSSNSHGNTGSHLHFTPNNIFSGKEIGSLSSPSSPKEAVGGSSCSENVAYERNTYETGTARKQAAPIKHHVVNSQHVRVNSLMGSKHRKPPLTPVKHIRNQSHGLDNVLLGYASNKSVKDKEDDHGFKSKFEIETGFS